MGAAREENDMEASKVVADEPCFVWAITVLEGGQKRLIVRHSGLITSDDPMLNPVRDVLDEQCSSKDVDRVEEDPSMMFGEAVILEYKLLKVCPGAEVDHRCVEEALAA